MHSSGRPLTEEEEEGGKEEEEKGTRGEFGGRRRSCVAFDVIHDGFDVRLCEGRGDI